MSMDKREQAVPWSFQGKGDIYIDAFPQIQLVTGWAVEVTSAEAALKVLGVDPIKGSLPEDYYYEEPLYKALTRMGRELKVKYKVCDQEDAILPYPPFKCFMCSDLPRLMVEGRNRYIMLADLQDFPTAGPETAQYSLWDDDPKLLIPYEGKKLNLKKIVRDEVFGKLEEALGDAVKWRTLPHPNFMKTWDKIVGDNQERSGFMP